MKKIIITIIALLASVGLIAGVSNNKVYALEVDNTIDYQKNTAVHLNAHYVYDGLDWFFDAHGTPSIDDSSLTLENLGLSYWNANTFVISQLVLKNSVGFINPPSGVNSLIEIVCEDGTKAVFLEMKSTNSVYLLYDGLKEIEITTDVINDAFCGFILNIQLIVNSGTIDINTVIYTLQVVQYINGNWNIISYPEYYQTFNVQGFGSTIFIFSDREDINITTNTFSTYNILTYEYLSSNLLENNAPITNKSVWDDIAITNLNYLQSTVGLPIVGYDASKVNANYYQSGFDAGKETGYELGYAEGLEKGQNAGTSWIATISQGVGHVLSMEIAPNLPLGLLVAIPLVMGMIGLILRYWRKD